MNKLILFRLTEIRIIHLDYIPLHRLQFLLQENR